MSKFYSGKGGATTSSFKSSATSVYQPASSSGSSYFSSIGKATSAPLSTAGLFSKPEPQISSGTYSRLSPSRIAPGYGQDFMTGQVLPRAGTPGAQGNWQTGLPQRLDSMGRVLPQTYSQGGPIADAKGNQWVKQVDASGKFAGYMNQFGQTASGFSRPSSGGVSYGGGGGGGMIAPPTQLEFYLGPAPEMQPLNIDYANFKNVLEQTQLSPTKVRELVSQYNMSGDDFNALVAAFNPTDGQIAGAISLINDPSRLNAIAEGLNRPYREAFERAMPMYEQNMGIANALANEYLRGGIPGDVQGQVMRNAAVQRMQTGLFGQSGLGRNIVPRDLGLTSLDMQARGASLLAQTGQLATQVLQATMPVSGRDFAVSPDTIYRSMRVSPDALLNATYIPARDIFSAYTVPASQIFDTYVSQAQYNQQIANQNLLNRWQTQALPGQFDISRGQFVGFQPGTYSDTRPVIPGTKTTYWQGRRA